MRLPWGIRILATVAVRTSGMGGLGVLVGLDLSAFRVVRSAQQGAFVSAVPQGRTRMSGPGRPSRLKGAER
jgi:hypothetical protein